MKARNICVALSVGVLIAFAASAGSGEGDKNTSVWKPFLSKTDYGTLARRELNGIKEMLQGKPDEKALRIAQYRALLLAGHSMSTKEPIPGLKANALQFAKMVRSGSSTKELQAFADSLARFKFDKTAKADDVKWKAHADLIVLMRPTDFKQKGGEGLPKALQSNARFETSLNSIEEKLRYLARRPLRDTYMTKEAVELKWFGYRMAVLGSLTDEFVPRKGDPKLWHKTSADMRDAGVALAEAAAKRDADALHKASSKLEASCYQCHKVYRTPAK